MARQLVFAGVPLPTLRHVFITHHHSDHNADYGNLIWLAWTAGLATRVDTWGPRPLEKMTRLFDAADRSIVISGDTAPSDNLMKLARDADVLVHAVVYVPAVDRLVARVPNAARLKASIVAHQTSVEDAARLAQAAGVKTLVLSHLIPADDPDMTDQLWIDAARTHFHGSIIVGKDLLEI